MPGRTLFSAPTCRPVTATPAIDWVGATPRLVLNREQWCSLYTDPFFLFHCSSPAPLSLRWPARLVKLLVPTETESAAVGRDAHPTRPCRSPETLVPH